MRLLLLSNSQNYGQGYLDHAVEAIRDNFDGIRRILFVPFALHDHDGYTRKVRERFHSWGMEVEGLDAGDGARERIDAAGALFIGGGNTFRLLDALQTLELIEPIRRKTVAGAPYMGSSAGTVISAPTLKTTNDMPIVQPRSFDALGFLPFQINCHYLDPDPLSRHMGETRELRVNEYLEENPLPVLGLREGAMLDVRGADRPTSIRLRGTVGARLFRRDREPEEIETGADLSHLLSSGDAPPRNR